MTTNQDALATLEHCNVTVADPDATAAMCCRLFDWEVRWTGEGKEGGRTVHVGGPNSYIALWTPAAPVTAGWGRLNHVGVLVADLDEAERRVKAEGLVPFNHGDYEPGRRFYFLDGDEMEWEVVSYA